MDKKLKDAIQLIEDAGGFVMLQGSNEEEYSEMTDERIEELEKEQVKYLKDYQERKRDAFKDFDKMLGSKNFSFSEVENMLYDYGVDLDDLEDYIHENY